MRRVVVVVVDPGNSPDRPPVPFGQKQVDDGVLVKRVFFRVETLAFGDLQGRNPVRVVFVELVRVTDKALQVAPGRDLPDPHCAHGLNDPELLADAPERLEQPV